MAQWGKVLELEGNSYISLVSGDHVFDPITFDDTVVDIIVLHNDNILSEITLPKLKKKFIGKPYSDYLQYVQQIKNDS